MFAYIYICFFYIRLFGCVQFAKSSSLSFRERAPRRRLLCVRCTSVRGGVIDPRQLSRLGWKDIFGPGDRFSKRARAETDGEMTVRVFPIGNTSLFHVDIQQQRARRRGTWRAYRKMIGRRKHGVTHRARSQELGSLYTIATFCCLSATLIHNNQQMRHDSGKQKS